MDPPGRHAAELARTQLLGAHLAGVVLQLEQQPAGQHEDRFVLDLVPLADSRLPASITSTLPT